MGISAAVRINPRTDAITRRVAEQLFSELELDMSTALNMFLKQFIREQALPIRPTISHIPNVTTMQATEYAEATRRGEISEDGAVFDNVDNAVRFLDTLV